MGNCVNKHHAEHNEKVCNYFSKKSDFADWIITTAFYSSLHYVRSVIVPYFHRATDGSEKQYNDFESLYYDLKRDTEGRHGFQLRLVTKDHKDIAIEYQRLYEMSQEARYSNYKYGRKASDEACKSLKKIKEYCLAS